LRAQTLTPFQLFGNQGRYVVPMFQRPYVWNREEQWEPLWQDVRTLAERMLEESSAGVREEAPTHFLGAIVLDQQFAPTAFIPARHIIDGQQRLTTLQLLLDAAEAVVREHGLAADASALRGLILNNAAIAQSPDDVFKVWPTNYDRSAFRAAMTDGHKPTGDDAKSQIVKAHEFFSHEIAEWAELDGDPEKVRQRLHSLTLALTQSLRLVVIDLEDGDNAQVIFETLNHRGTPLLAADLVKNFVFQIAEADGLDPETLYEEHWKKFDSKEWRRSVGTGSQKRPRLDVFLNYWLVMRTLREVPADRVFTDFRSLVSSAETGVIEHVRDLSASAEVFERLERADAFSLEGTFYYRVLSVLRQSAWGPFLLWLYREGPDAVEPAQRERALKAAESWAIRRMLVRAPTRAITALVVDLLRVMDEAPRDEVGEALSRYLAEQTVESRYWPSDSDVRSAVVDQPIYGRIPQARVRMILEELEDQARTPLAEEGHCTRGKLTIEHVMPQGWREHWRLPGERTPELESMDRDRYIHTLGNLTLVNNKLNPALSNRPWLDSEAVARGLGKRGKQSILEEHSVLVLNREILRGHPDQWTEEAIRRRGERMAEQIIQSWPRFAPAG